MGKGSGCVYKNVQPNCPHPSTNSTFVVPPHLFFILQHDSTNDCGVTIIAHKQTLSVSNLTITMQVDTYSTNYDNTQYFFPQENKITAPLKYLKQQLQLLWFRLLLISPSMPNEFFNINHIIQNPRICKRVSLFSE